MDALYACPLNKLRSAIIYPPHADFVAAHNHRHLPGRQDRTTPDLWRCPCLMSIAFTKEIDDAPPAPLPERALSDAPNYVTGKGAREIEDMITRLQRQITTAAGSHATDLRRDLRYWLARKSSMQIVPVDPEPVRVGFGVVVSMQRGGKSSAIQLVGTDEAHPRQGLIAWTSPLARALEGAAPGDTVELKLGDRVELITVVAVMNPGARP